MKLTEALTISHEVTTASDADLREAFEVLNIYVRKTGSHTSKLAAQRIADEINYRGNVKISVAAGTTHLAPAPVATVPGEDWPIRSMVTNLEGILSVQPDGTVTFAPSVRSLRAALIEQSKG